MAKDTTDRPRGGSVVVPPKLAGKTFTFTGKIHSSTQEHYTRLIEAEGGAIVGNVTTKLDYLVVGRVRGRTPEVKEAERLNQNHGSAIQMIQESTLRSLFACGPEDALALLRGGKAGVERWNRLQELACWSRSPVDLSGVDMRGVRLDHARLQGVIWDTADFRAAHLAHTSFDQLKGVRLDGAQMVHACVSQARSCSFRKADLTEAHINPADFSGSDFTGAKLRKVFGAFTQAADVVFRKADLTEAGLEESRFSQADFTEADLSRARLARCDFTGARLRSARLVGAELTDVKLVNADLTKADLRDAMLVGADLTGATINGADFTGADVTGAVLIGLNGAKAKGLTSSATAGGGKVGPNILELEKVARQSRRLEVSAVIAMKDQDVILRFTSYRNAQWVSTYSATPGMGHCSGAQTVSAAMVDLARRWTKGTLRLDAIMVKSSKAPVGGKELRRLAVAAWCEACGVPIPSEQDIQQHLTTARACQDAVRERLLRHLRGGAAGVKRWNATPDEERKKAGSFRGVDLSGADLTGAVLSSGNAPLDFRGAAFDRAILVKVNLSYGDLRGACFRDARLDELRCGISKASRADFRGASLRNAHLRVCTFSSAAFDGADLSGADFGYADLRCADLSGANLADVKFEQTKYNEKTLFPKGFKPPEGLLWRGAGDPPGTRKPRPPRAAGPLDFDAFLKRLRSHTDASRLANALRMLKADRFKLFAEVESDRLVGVVKSQTDRDLVYSCRLASDGSFGCCTQNLKPCGGLAGKLCKHLLVLVIGLAKAGELDPGKMDAWVRASRSKRPSPDKDAMSDTFLRYKGAEAGEIDWRPTETIPEDFYAL